MYSIKDLDSEFPILKTLKGAQLIEGLADFILKLLFSKGV